MLPGPHPCGSGSGLASAGPIRARRKSQARVSDVPSPLRVTPANGFGRVRHGRAAFDPDGSTPADSHLRAVRTLTPLSMTSASASRMVSALSSATCQLAVWPRVFGCHSCDCAPWQRAFRVHQKSPVPAGAPVHDRGPGGGQRKLTAGKPFHPEHLRHGRLRCRPEP